MSDASKISEPHQRPLGDESFMTADDLRNYMDQVALARANEAVEAMDKADKAKQELAKTLSEPLDLTPAKIAEIEENVLVKLRAAAGRGETEMMVMRFPNTLCTDNGRAINNALEGWPETLTGRPRQAYELWRDQLKPKGFGLAAMIVEWPRGMPGDVGFFLTWGRG
ncbi:hypothetical protein MKI84_08805 [Ancylobacter sp. A5.8]|uniref:hypothetical protein n=1 Tax=Ancylobacter gelatini TaxID=2919920 RepID=UPI001F4E30FC|nr:hypothetical protein [Ancylobacter gelatini]MCJ8143015.1 hypothetical protein [Ancylobacter gelatini]